MASTNIQKNPIAKQVNIGDQFGDLWATWNIDLTSNPGKIRVSPKPLMQYSTLSHASFVSPFACVRNASSTPSTDMFFVVCEQAVFSCTTASGITFLAKDTIASSPTTALSSLYSDAINLNGTLAIALKTDIALLSGGTWNATYWTTTLSKRALVNSVPHPECLGFNNLYLVADQVVGAETSGATAGQPSIHTITNTNTVSLNRLIFPAEYEIMWIRSSNSLYWIGARHKFGGIGKVYTWDGYSDNFNQDYKVGAQIPYSCVIKDEIPYTINNNGELLQFNGGNFVPIDRLPIANHKTKRWDNDGTIPPSNGWTVHRNGMSLIENKISILVGGGVEGNNYQFLENQLSGVWEYTPETGLYHKYPMVKGNNSGIRDYGSPVIVNPGFLYEVGKIYGNFFAGARLLSDGSSTNISVLNAISGDTNDKMGYFITPRIYGNSVEEMWQKAFITLKPLTTSGHFVSLKYRTSADYTDTFDQLGNWTSTTTFLTSATEFSTVSSRFDSTTPNYEVEILSGEGSGQSAQITAISLSGSYAVTLGTALTNASGNFRYRTSNWKTIDSITDLVSTSKSFPIGKNANWIQFKVLMFGAGDSPEIEKVTVVSEPQISAK